MTIVQHLAEFFKRDLISIPLTKKHQHQSIQQRCGLKAATFELDTSAYPNIEYIAGNRLSIYPQNPAEQVSAIMKHLIDDLEPPQQQQSHPGTTKKRPRITSPITLSEPLAKFVQYYKSQGLKIVLTYLYDITTAPSRDLLKLMSTCCSDPEHKSRLSALGKSDDAWEKWVCSGFRTLKSTLDEFYSCQKLSARCLVNELALQQPRQYSISSIKSSKRFRTEIIVFQHKFTSKQVASSLLNIREREKIQQQDGGGPLVSLGSKSKSPASPGRPSSPSRSIHVNGATSQRSTGSVRSLRSVATQFGVSPISTQQVKRVPSFSGPLMSMYATSSLNQASVSTSTPKARIPTVAGTPQTPSVAGAGLTVRRSQTQPGMEAGSSASIVKSIMESVTAQSAASSSTEKQYDGLCSNYLLNLNPNDHIICEFVENPRFTLKGNRERPIMMIGQDVGVVAFRPFWQQRALEHDRAQVFYTLFKDLSPKKFGDMQLVCLVGNRCKVEDLFKREINSVVTNKILSSASYINKSHLISLLDSAAAHSLSGGSYKSTTSGGTIIKDNNYDSGGFKNQLPIEAKDLMELGKRISKLLVENNGCLYTCCDPQMTQAIEILVVESIARSSSLPRDKIMALLPKWKGRRYDEQPLINNKFLFTLENPFERAQIVQEIYDSSI